MLTNRTYDVLKWVTLILLPASSTLYLTLSKVWNLPYADEISATVVAVVLFLGVVLGISTIEYNKQFINRSRAELSTRFESESTPQIEDHETETVKTTTTQKNHTRH